MRERIGKPTEASAAPASPPEPARARWEAARAALGWLGLVLAIARRPALPVVGVLLCAIAGWVGALVGQDRELLELARYVPFLGGGWAVWAADRSARTGSDPAGQLPDRRRALAYAATALVVVVLSGLARVTLTVLGGLLVGTLLALGPVVALAEGSWPHRALWRGLLFVDEAPKSFIKVAVASLVVALLFGLVFEWGSRELLGAAAGRRLADGASQGLGSVVIAAIWMRFYLMRQPPPAPSPS